MSYAKATLVADIRRILNDAPAIDYAAEAMDTTETGLDVADGTLYSPGQIVEFQDDGEQCLIQSISGNTLTVVRNYNISVTTTPATGTSHANATRLLIDPVFPYRYISDAISASIAGLWPYVYKEVADSITPDGSHWYNVSTASLAIRELSSAIQATTSTPSRPFYYGVNRGAYPIELRFNIPTSIAANGAAYYIPYAQNLTNAIVIAGIGKLADTQTTPGTYDDFSAGVEADCIKYYAVARLVASTDISRTTQEDITMGDQTVKSSDRTRIAGYWEQKALEERNKWKMELDITLPRMKKWGHY
jgi:hypothetical protein